MYEVERGDSDAQPLASPYQRPRRRHFSKDLWTLLVLLAAASVGMIWLLSRAWHQYDLVTQVKAAGGRVAHHWEWSDGQIDRDRPAPLWTDLLSRFPCGPEFCTRVVFVDLSESPKAEDAMTAIAGLSDLRGLDLGLTDVSGADLRYVRALRELEGLSLTGLALHDSDLTQLANLKQLKRLNLSGTGITDAALSHLRDLPNLERLDLSRTRITDSGLASLVDHWQLESLTLDDTTITDAGLVTLSRLASLRWLSLENSLTTEAGISSLKKRLHGLRVVRSE